MVFFALQSRPKTTEESNYPSIDFNNHCIWALVYLKYTKDI